MERIYENYAAKYFERGFLAVPLEPKSKATHQYGWTTKEYYKNPDELIAKHREGNIGVLLGELTGVIAVDIDKDMGLAICPPSPVRKKGQNGETRFFKYNGEPARKRHDIGLELLSTGNQTVMPPSIHPKTNAPYVWLTPDTLLDFNIEDLPVLSQEFVSLMDQKPEGKTRHAVSKSDGTRCNNGSHNQLSAMLVAAIHAGDTPETIVKNLIDYDSKINPDISYFLCPDRKEWRSKNKTVNAFKFVMEGFDRNIRVGDIEDVNLDSDGINLLDEVLESDKFIRLERKPMPNLRGIGQEMFEYVYNYSFTKRSHFIFPSILSVGSIALGNKVQFRKTLPNIYCLIAGDSTSGKSVAIEFVKELLQKSGTVGDLLGEGNPSGDTAIIQNLPNQRVRLDIVDESDNLFATINSTNSYGQKVAYTYAELFTSAGKTFAGKTTSAMKGAKSKEGERGSIGGCFAPYVSLLMGITFEGFKKYVSATTIKQGFLGRFLFFSDNNKKRRKYPTGEQPDMPKHFVDFMKMWRNVKPRHQKEGLDLSQAPAMTSFDINECAITEEGELALREAFEKIEDIFEKEPSNSDILPIIGRAFEYVKKLAMIDCAFLNPYTTDLKICKTNVDWAYKVVTTILENNRSFLPDNINEGLVKEYMRKVEAYLKEKGTVTKKEFTRKFQSKKSKENEDYLKSLEEAGIISITKDKAAKTVYINYLT